MSNGESNSQSTNLPKEKKIKLRNTDFYGGPGIQHISNRWYYQNGIAIESKRNEFLSAPPHTYYEAIPERLGAHMEWWKKILRNWKTIMVDADEDGYLLQIFKPVQDRPTLFWNYSKNGCQVWAETLKHFGVNWENSNCEERYKKHYFTYCEKITNNQPISW
jgi:hypothetical protein